MLVQKASTGSWGYLINPTIKELNALEFVPSGPTSAVRIFMFGALDLPLGFRPLAVERIDYGKCQRGAAEL